MIDDEPPTNKTVSRYVPVFSADHLNALDREIQCDTVDFSLHANIIVLWDADYDNRVLDLIDQEWPPGKERPLAVAEREGWIGLLWPDECAARRGSWRNGEYFVCGDTWQTTHLYIDGLRVCKLEPEPTHSISKLTAL